jgi:hypothetical protein
METCLSQRLTDEESPESRMREIRPSGLMRGGDIAAKLTTAVSSIRPRSLRPLYPKIKLAECRHDRLGLEQCIRAKQEICGERF